MTTYDRKRSLRRIGPIIDRTNIVISAVIIICAVIILLDIKNRLFLFPVIFTLAAVMNGLMAFKCFKMAETLRMVFLLIAFVFLAILSIIGYIVTLS
jgi:hypothetical protein